MANKKWTKQDDETLLKLKKKRLSYLDIAEIMGDKTTDSLRNRYYILTHKQKTFEDVESEAKVLVFDIETSLMEFTGFQAGRVFYIGKHQLVRDYYIISWAAKWLGEDRAYGKVLRPTEAKKGRDGRILKPMWKMLDEADIVVGHNVDRFDTKRLNTRFAINGLGLPSSYKSVDTLKVAKKSYAFTFNDLDFVCRTVGVKGKDGNEDGYEMWLGCREGDSVALEKMLYYNVEDVEATERLYNFLKMGINPPKPPRGGWKADRE